MATKAKKTTAAKGTAAKKPRINRWKNLPDTPEAPDQAGSTKMPRPVRKRQTPDKSERGLSALDAAAKVLEEASTPLASKEMIEAMQAKGYWTSPGGKTPHATLYSAILREINVKGEASRFLKTERGRFTLSGATTPVAPESEKGSKTSKSRAKKGAATPAAADSPEGNSNVELVQP